MLETSRRFLLRERTAKAHEALDARVGPIETLSDYRRYLSGTAGFRLAVEAWFERLDWPDSRTWRPTLLARHLRDDLADLAVDLPKAPAAAPAAAVGLLGVFYVLEGSNLGAQLTRRRAAALGLTGEHGARHLLAQAEGLQNWRAFLLMLEAETQFDLDEAVDGALDAFRMANAAFGAGALPT